MSSPIVVMSALAVELELLLAEATGVGVEQLPTGRAWRCSIAGVDVVLAQTGLGKVNTATAVGVLHERHHPGLFILTGVAGGLDEQLAVGDVVIGERLIQHDAGVIEPGGLTRYQAGHVPFFNPTDLFGFTPSSSLIELVHEAIDGLTLEPVLGRRPRIAFGTILTGDQYLRDPETRNRLHRELGGLAVEMEGGAMAQAASRVGAEALVIRSLSDLAGTDSIDDFTRFVSEVAANSARVVLRVIPLLS